MLSRPTHESGVHQQQIAPVVLHSFGETSRSVQREMWCVEDVSAAIAVIVRQIAPSGSDEHCSPGHRSERLERRFHVFGADLLIGLLLSVTTVVGRRKSFSGAT